MCGVKEQKKKYFLAFPPFLADSNTDNENCCLTLSGKILFVSFIVSKFVSLTFAQIKYYD